MVSISVLMFAGTVVGDLFTYTLIPYSRTFLGVGMGVGMFIRWHLEGLGDSTIKRV